LGRSRAIGFGRLLEQMLTAIAPLRSLRGRLLKECVGPGERGGRAQPDEDLAGFTEDRRGIHRSCKPKETPAPGASRGAGSTLHRVTERLA
jgi:hypothetical protein